MAATTVPPPAPARSRRRQNVIEIGFVALLAAGLVVLAVDGFTADGPRTAAPVAGTQSGEVATPISGFAFPASLTIAVGSTVNWVNEDPADHTVTAADGSFDSGALPQGARFRATFTAPGTYEVTCRIHPDMHGRVTVVPEG